MKQKREFNHKERKEHIDSLTGFFSGVCVAFAVETMKDWTGDLPSPISTALSLRSLRSLRLNIRANPCPSVVKKSCGLSFLWIALGAASA